MNIDITGGWDLLLIISVCLGFAFLFTYAVKTLKVQFTPTQFFFVTAFAMLLGGFLVSWVEKGELLKVLSVMLAITLIASLILWLWKRASRRVRA